MAAPYLTSRAVTTAARLAIGVPHPASRCRGLCACKARGYHAPKGADDIKTSGKEAVHVCVRNFQFSICLPRRRHHSARRQRRNQSKFRAEHRGQSGQPDADVRRKLRRRLAAKPQSFSSPPTEAPLGRSSALSTTMTNRSRWKADGSAVLVTPTRRIGPIDTYSVTVTDSGFGSPINHYVGSNRQRPALDPNRPLRPRLRRVQRPGSFEPGNGRTASVNVSDDGGSTIRQ